MTQTADALRRRAEEAGQGHVFRFYDELTDASRASLCAAVAGLDFRLLGELAQLRAARAPGAVERRFAPAELFPLAAHAGREADAARRRGRELLAQGQVGYVLVAGGQASRLGYDGPKGAYPVGPVSRLPLFGFHAHRLRAAAARHGCRTPWAIMTSPANDAVTRAFFREHAYFGLPEEDVFFFAQEMLPALDDHGRILMSAPDQLFLAPNGHGGVLWGLATSGLLAEFRARGVTQLSYFQVDNPLARPADELFLGLHAAAGAGMSSKVVKKRDAAEKVGVLGRVDGRMGCIEYSDMPAHLREQRDPDGELTYRAGNIAVHVIERAFVEELTRERLALPWHMARKKVRVIDGEGRTVEAFGTKFETFVFDALARSRASATLEVERAQEFSPVKNAEGEDSPATCRRDLCKLWGGWVAEAGRALPGADATGVHPVEVSPLAAETKEEFLRRTDLVPHVQPLGHLYR
jgi:UDP-N-acetylglucosamine/UDP-N-acetylgalactosamine diphosphorylase